MYCDSSGKFLNQSLGIYFFHKISSEASTSNNLIVTSVNVNSIWQILLLLIINNFQSTNHALNVLKMKLYYMHTSVGKNICSKVPCTVF